MGIVIGPAASATAWEEARKQVRDDLWRNTESALPNDQVDRALHSSIQELEAAEKWLWLQTINGSFTVASSADFADLGADIKAISHLAYLSGSVGYDVLDMQPLQFVRQLERGTTAGDPTYYALADDGRVYFDAPVPDNSEFELVYYSRCPAVLADAIATPPASLTLQRPAIVANAAHFAALTYLKNEAEATRQRAVYERILERLQDEESDARSDDAMGGTIQGDTVLHDMAHGYGGYN